MKTWKPRACFVTRGYGMDQVKRCAEQCGSHWFEPSTTRFFRSRVGSDVYTDGRGGAYFVSSEQGPHGPRLFSIRYYDPNKCSIETIGKFQQYASGEAAKRVAKKIAAKSQTRRRGYRMERQEELHFKPEGEGPPERVIKYRRMHGA